MAPKPVIIIVPFSSGLLAMLALYNMHVISMKWPYPSHTPYVGESRWKSSLAYAIFAVLCAFLAVIQWKYSNGEFTNQYLWTVGTFWCICVAVRMLSLVRLDTDSS